MHTFTLDVEISVLCTVSWSIAGHIHQAYIHSSTRYERSDRASVTPPYGHPFLDASVLPCVWPVAWSVRP